MINSKNRAIFRIIISENFNKYIKGSSKYNEKTSPKYWGNCYCLIRDHARMMKNMENKGWLKVNINEPHEKSLILFRAIAINHGLNFDLSESVSSFLKAVI